MKNANRRQFCAAMSATAVAATTPLASMAGGFHQSGTDRLRIACIGVGGRGGSNLNSVAQDPGVEIKVLCDVDARRLDLAKKKYPAARTIQDFRKFYESADDIDAVVVSTTEHTHAFATMPALKQGKHVYCEKPLTHNVFEARAITKAAAEANVATQMGTQIHAGKNYHRVVELIQAGVIGDVTEAHVWVGRAWGLQSKEDAEANRDRVSIQNRPAESMPVPDYLDWDLWLGPAPERPYNSIYFPGPNWYRWWDFGNGTMSDLGSHWNDLPFWALQLDAPLSIKASGPEPHPELAPASMSATYQYGSRGDQPPCSLTWYQGSEKPQIWIDKGIPQWGSGCLFVGSGGMLLADYGKYLLLPENKFVDSDLPPSVAQPPSSHHQQWLDACRHGTPTGSPFSYAGPLTEANHLGNVAFRVGKEIAWDAASLSAPGVPEADAFLRRTPRSGWSLEG